MLYTRKGDSGTTKVLNSKDRLLKSSLLFEALGSVDELNSFLGLCKVKNKDQVVIEMIQQDLFIIQAELAGADMTVDAKKVQRLEDLINEIEKKLPVIKSFFVSGGTELASIFDIARTIARRAERAVIRAMEVGEVKLSHDTMCYLNRLSSVLYVLAREANHSAGIKEKTPSYIS